MTNSLAGFDFLSEEHLRNPHPGYELARDESPVYKIPGQDAIWVFGYDEVLEALMNPKVFSSKNREALLGNAIYDPKCQEIFERGWPQVDTLLTNDPPSHTRFKKLVNRAFTRERVDGMDCNLDNKCHGGRVQSFASVKNSLYEQRPHHLSLRMVNGRNVCICDQCIQYRLPFLYNMHTSMH